MARLPGRKPRATQPRRSADRPPPAVRVEPARGADGTANGPGNISFSALFAGVCATCSSRGNSQVPAEVPVAAAHLPPAAGPAIARVARCCGLTRRETQVLTLVCTGVKNRVLAEVLGLSVSSVRMHLRNLHKKTNTADKVELILNLWHSCAAAGHGEVKRQNLSIETGSDPGRGVCTVHGIAESPPGRSGVPLLF